MTETELRRLLQNNPDLSVADGIVRISLPLDTSNTFAIPQASIAGERTPDSQPKRNKYHAQRTEIDGIVFDSKAEAARYARLRLREMAGEISQLRRQVKFPVHVAGQHICDYVVDFDYLQDGRRVVEDVKGVKTPVYRLKKKLVEAIYGIEIVEVGHDSRTHRQ